jgi:hypothetical protein
MESPKVVALRKTMLNKIALIHENVATLMELNPGVYDALGQKLNSFVSETVAKVRARMTRDLNKGTTEAIVVEPEAVTP